MSEYPLAQGHYYGVDYGERGRKGVPPSEVPRQFVPAALRSDSSWSQRPVADYAPNDLSFYANIPVPTSYMCMGSQEDFFGGYDHAAQAGIVHVANHHISPGKKQWTWGNHEFGYAWDRNLTDPTRAANTALTSKSWPASTPTTSPTSASCSPARPRRGASTGIRFSRSARRSTRTSTRPCRSACSHARGQETSHRIGRLGHAGAVSARRGLILHARGQALFSRHARPRARRTVRR